MSYSCCCMVLGTLISATKHKKPHTRSGSCMNTHWQETLHRLRLQHLHMCPLVGAFHQLLSCYIWYIHIYARLCHFHIFTHFTAGEDAHIQASCFSYICILRQIRILSLVIYVTIYSGEQHSPSVWVHVQNVGSVLLRWFRKQHSTRHLHFPRCSNSNQQQVPQWVLYLSNGLLTRRQRRVTYCNQDPIAQKHNLLSLDEAVLHLNKV